MRCAKFLAAVALLSAAIRIPSAIAAELPVVTRVESQPFFAQVRRLIDATDYLGSPFTAADKRALEAAIQKGNSSEAVESAQKILDGYCLFAVEISPLRQARPSPDLARLSRVSRG